VQRFNAVGLVALDARHGGGTTGAVRGRGARPHPR
jgi:hypothetical protein